MSVITQLYVMHLVAVLVQTIVIVLPRKYVKVLKILVQSFRTADGLDKQDCTSPCYLCMAARSAVLSKYQRELAEGRLAMGWPSRLS